METDPRSHKRSQPQAEDAGMQLTDEATLFASPLPIVGARKTTTRKEVWSWYLYYVGNSGLGPFNFAISAWQNLLYNAGWDPAYPRGTMPCGDGGTALYILGLIGYQGALTFWTAAFPGLARDLPEIKESEERLAKGQTDQKSHDQKDMLALLCAIPWLLFEQYRPGNQLPPHTSYITVGVKQIYHAFRLCLRLKQTFIYLAAYFFLGDCLNTVVIATLQNEVVSYDTKFLNYLLIDGIAAQALGIGIFWLVQKRYTIPTKTMLLFIFVCPWYAISQAMISEVVPRGKESRKECRKYLEDEAMRVYGMSSAEVLAVNNGYGMDGVRSVAVGEDKN
ncbi:uncharacterized protein IL334_006331 [Kwoniella shivajii]|uniref:Autophagy-related protein n=1 Tax=Kwoniella shivajii TaxID=564305 RepID=A0ABZ1D6W5_9TREE|nr:hypothetical protein IL334_006331 [Kwoniella shivajii]